MTSPSEPVLSNPEPSVTKDSPQSGGQLLFWVTLFAVYGIFITYSMMRIPIPGVNEPHYLCKAKHFWNPNWCAGDLFLESSNPHVVFYATFGWLTNFLSLETTAVIARFVSLIPLAVGWHLLAVRLIRSPWGSLLSAAIFLLLQSAGNWSGEWVVGGAESKVIAYGFLFWATAQAMDLKLRSSAALAGLAISFHPVVGVWGVLATTMGTLAWVFIHKDRKELLAKCPALSTWLIAIVLFSACAAPGLISAASAVLSGDPESSRIATLLQVGTRLAHHLDPMKFHKESYRYFLAMILVWGLLARGAFDQKKGGWWQLIVVASLIIAVIGIGIGWGPRPLKAMPGYEWRMNALKFYPFRLADLLVPIVLSLAAAAKILNWFDHKTVPRTMQTVSLCGIAIVLTGLAIRIPGSDRNPSRMSPEKLQTWIEACRWIQEHSEPNTLIHSFDNQFAVKWFSQRPEYVNYKDCPQDAKSMIEWNQRRWKIARWRTAAFQDGRVSQDELNSLSEQTGIQIFICDRLGPIDVEPVFRNKEFRLYQAN